MSASTASPTSSALSIDRILALAASSVADPPRETYVTNAYEAIALVGHACMTAVGFRLIGLGEDHKLGISSMRHSQESRLTRW